MDVQLDEDKRKDVFRMLVRLQDVGRSVAQSRGQVANRYSVGVSEVLNIEREGINKSWPPLENCR